jgi:tyrosine-protein phosphatase SIW14
MRRSAAFVLAIGLAIVPAFADGTLTGLPNFHRVDEHVYRGGQPTAEGFQSLAKMGVKTIVDLRGPEHSEADEKRIVETAGMKYVSIPMKGLQAPSDSEISRALALMNDSAAWPVFVHCRRGADRTGTVIACYRIQKQRWDNNTALREARANGMSWLERAMQHYVVHFNAAAIGGAVPATAAPANAVQ